MTEYDEAEVASYLNEIASDTELVTEDEVEIVEPTPGSTPKGTFTTKMTELQTILDRNYVMSNKKGSNYDFICNNCKHPFTGSTTRGVNHIIKHCRNPHKDYKRLLIKHVKDKAAAKNKNEQRNKSIGLVAGQQQIPAAWTTSFNSFQTSLSQMHAQLVKFLVCTQIPFSLVEHPEFINFLSAVSAVEPKQLKINSRKSLMSTYLPEVYKKSMIQRNEHMKQWDRFGFTIMNDGQTCRKRGILNTCIAGNGCILSVRSTNCTGTTKDAAFIANDIQEALLSLGDRARDCFLLAIDGGGGCRQAGEKFEELNPKAFAQRCSLHGGSLLASDITTKIPMFKKMAETVLKLCTFICNHEKLRSEFDENCPENLKRPSPTRMCGYQYLCKAILADLPAIKELVVKASFVAAINKLNRKQQVSWEALRNEVLSISFGDTITTYCSILHHVCTFVRAMDRKNPTLVNCAYEYHIMTTEIHKLDYEFGLMSQVRKYVDTRNKDCVSYLATAAALVDVQRFYTEDHWTKDIGYDDFMTVAERYYKDDEEALLHCTGAFHTFRQKQGCFGTSSAKRHSRLGNNVFWEIFATSFDVVNSIEIKYKYLCELALKLCNGYAGQGIVERENKSICGILSSKRNRLSQENIQKMRVIQSVAEMSYKQEQGYMGTDNMLTLFHRKLKDRKRNVVIDSDDEDVDAPYDELFVDAFDLNEVDEFDLNEDDDFFDGLDLKDGNVVEDLGFDLNTIVSDNPRRRKRNNPNQEDEEQD